MEINLRPIKSYIRNALLKSRKKASEHYRMFNPLYEWNIGILFEDEIKISIEKMFKKEETGISDVYTLRRLTFLKRLIESNTKEFNNIDWKIAREDYDEKKHNEYEIMYGRSRWNEIIYKSDSNENDEKKEDEINIEGTKDSENDEQPEKVCYEPDFELKKDELNLVESDINDKLYENRYHDGTLVNFRLSNENNFCFILTILNNNLNEHDFENIKKIIYPILNQYTSKPPHLEIKSIESNYYLSGIIHIF